jgi:secretion/DNA translocation related TadE-like protein
MRCARERGSATVHAAVLIALLATVTLVAVSVAGLFVGQRRAAAAADLAALAGAAAVQHGGNGCSAAGRIAAQNHTRLSGCAADGDVVSVRVTARVRSWFATDVAVHARARAGPAP